MESSDEDTPQIQAALSETCEKQCACALSAAPLCEVAEPVAVELPMSSSSSTGGPRVPLPRGPNDERSDNSFCFSAGSVEDSVVDAWRRPFSNVFNKQMDLHRALRPLRVWTGCSGMGTPTMGLGLMGVDYVEEVACDPKPAALQYRKAHQKRLPSVYFATLKECIEGVGMCLVSGQRVALHHFSENLSAHDASPPSFDTSEEKLPEVKREASTPLASSSTPRSERPDMLVVGFSCRPGTRARVGRFEVGREPCTHPEYHTQSETVQLVERVRPYLFVLENVVGLGQKSTGADSEQSEWAAVIKTLSSGYEIRTCLLDISAYVENTRPRLYAIGVSLDIEGADHLCDTAMDIMRQMEDARSQKPPLSITECLLMDRFGGEEHRYGQPVPLPGGPERRLPCTAAQCGEWTTQARDVRTALWRSGCLYHTQQPWSVGLDGQRLPELHGQYTSRVRELLDIALLDQCWKMGIVVLTPSGLQDACARFFCNMSQNPARGDWGPQPRGPKQNKLSCITTRSKWYWYGGQREVEPEEMMRVLGFPLVAMQSPRQLNANALHDLVGNAMAVPCVTKAMLALLAACRDSLPSWFEKSGPSIEGSAAVTASAINATRSGSGPPFKRVRSRRRGPSEPEPDGV